MAGWLLTEGWLAGMVAGWVKAGWLSGWRALRIFGYFLYFVTLTKFSKGLYISIKNYKYSWRLAGGRLPADWQLAGGLLAAGLRLAGGLLLGLFKALLYKARS